MTFSTFKKRYPSFQTQRSQDQTSSKEDLWRLFSNSLWLLQISHLFRICYESFFGPIDLLKSCMTAYLERTTISYSSGWTDCPRKLSNSLEYRNHASGWRSALQLDQFSITADSRSQYCFCPWEIFTVSVKLSFFRIERSLKLYYQSFTFFEADCNRQSQTQPFLKLQMKVIDRLPISLQDL